MPALGIVNVDQTRTVMDVTTVTLIQNSDVTRVAQALECQPWKQRDLPALGRNTLHDRLNEQINGTAAHSTSVSLDAGDD